MQKYKILGPDGWHAKLFISFFDIFGKDIIRVASESESRGNILVAFNTTFILLILKFDNVHRMENNSPISLCNCIYKIVGKTIAIQIKGVISQSIYQEQFSFLTSKQIHDVVGIV